MTPDQQDTTLPKELELRVGSQPLKYVLWTKVQLSRGKRFGPILAQLKETEPTRLSAWKKKTLAGRKIIAYRGNITEIGRL
ncbi:uncharacterized protein TNCV_3757711 [Trichonephila clavipes]|nr:uncharacterized protein TNCV_3757711 [Trichonephila clavipes]